MSPYFGASTIVWANTIAVVLVSLSVGLLARRAARRRPPAHARPLFAGRRPRRSCWPWSRSPPGRSSRSRWTLSMRSPPAPSSARWSASSRWWRSRSSCSAPCSPWAIRLATPDVDHSGRTAGRLYAISTAGSLVGTMSAALLFIPFIGTQRTFLFFALTLGLVAAAGLGWRYLTVPAAVAAVIAIPVGTVKAKTDRGDRVIYETETRLQYARVVEEPDGDPQARAQRGRCRALPLSAGQLPDRQLLGRAAGAAVREPHPRPLRGSRSSATPPAPWHAPTATTSRRPQIDGVEIDPELAEIGRRYFDMRAPHLATPQRGRPALAAATRRAATT